MKIIILLISFFIAAVADDRILLARLVAVIVYPFKWFREVFYLSQYQPLLIHGLSLREIK